MTDNSSEERPVNATSVSRRRMLKLGMVAAPAIVTLKASPASAAESVACKIPITDYHGGYPKKPWKNVKHNGDLTSDPVGGPEDIVAPPSQRILDPANSGELVPGYTSDQIEHSSMNMPDHHLNYIRKLQRGRVGFTCFASIAARGVI